MTRTSSRRISYVIRDEQESFGGHLLGVNSLALDTTTVVNAIPEGILYSAGRDGMIAGWDLHLKDVQSQNRKISRANGHHRRPSSLRPEDEGAKVNCRNCSGMRLMDRQNQHHSAIRKRIQIG